MSDPQSNLLADEWQQEMSMSGKRVLVTEASKGVGRAEGGAEGDIGVAAGVYGGEGGEGAVGAG